MKFNLDKLRNLIRRKFRFENRVAELMEITQQHLSLKLNGKIPMYQEDLYKLMRILEIPESEVYQYFFIPEHLPNGK